MSNRSTIKVPHLGGTNAGYQTPGPLSPSKPTLILVNSFLTNSNLYQAQYGNKELTDAMNLVAIELLGHGLTRTKPEHWTYWDTAIMNLQVIDELEKRGEIKGQVFVLGTSQGGWITTRMALLAPERIAGIIPLGTSMDSESAATRELGCWNAPDDLLPMINELTTTSTQSDFVMPLKYADFLIDIGFGKSVAAKDREYWQKQIQTTYSGDDGRKRARMAAINLRDRDGLHSRLFDVRCPVLWLHGTNDPVYTVKNAEREMKLFVNSPIKDLASTLMMNLKEEQDRRGFCIRN